VVGWWGFVGFGVGGCFWWGFWGGGGGAGVARWPPSGQGERVPLFGKRKAVRTGARPLFFPDVRGWAGESRRNSPLGEGKKEGADNGLQGREADLITSLTTGKERRKKLGGRVLAATLECRNKKKERKGGGSIPSRKKGRQGVELHRKRTTPSYRRGILKGLLTSRQVLVLCRKKGKGGGVFLKKKERDKPAKRFRGGKNNCERIFATKRNSRLS